MTDFSAVAFLSVRFERSFHVGGKVEAGELAERTRLAAHAENDAHEDGDAGPDHDRDEPRRPLAVAGTHARPVVHAVLEEEAIFGAQAVARGRHFEFCLEVASPSRGG